jgi:molybdenum cofactor synthesis domain-containing protein
MGKIQSINISTEKGTKKKSIDKAFLKNNFGIDGDAHAGNWHRQVSFLGYESIEKMHQMGGLDVDSGDFAENITTEGIDLVSMGVGERLNVGGVEFIISQIGKKCHKHCEIYYSAGDCVMPREGIFGVVRGEGEIKVGDVVEKLPKQGFSVAVITLSDKGSRGERVDETGPAVVKLVEENLETSFIRTEIMADDQKELERVLIHFTEIQKMDIIITNGSTGISPRDIAPDATLNIIEKRLPGFEEAMRMESFKKVKSAITSRAVCGTRKNSFIINVPGSPKGAIENLEVVLSSIPHTVKKLQGDPEDCAGQH